MPNSQTPPTGTVVVAISFDEQAPALTKTAVSLARRFGVELCFVHVPPLSEDLLGLDYSASLYVYPMALPPTDKDLIVDAQGKLDEMLASLPSDVRHSSVVKVGHPIPVIVGEAVSRRASMILTACDPSGYGAFFQGISVSVGLMHEAPLPVLVVSQDCPVDFTKSSCKILFADDLQESTQEAARKTYELATRLGKGTKVRHVHVHGDFRELLKDSWIETRQEALALVTMQPPTEPLNAEIVREYERRQTALGGQGQPWRSAAEKAGVNVTLDMRTGKVSRELHAAIDDCAPDLIVFGRHRLLRARPFLVGRMPLRTMLKEKRAVLLVPAATELFARVGFPTSATEGQKS